MRLALLGVRGSTPAPGMEFAVTGGNTSCVAIGHDEDAPSLVLDAGTGLRRLSGRLVGQAFRGSILLTHLHWDHVQGLPFFSAGDHNGAEVRLAMPEQGNPVEVLSRAMSPPHFPIEPDDLRGHWEFASLAAGRHRIEDFDVLALEIAHKGGRTFGYRVENGRSSVAFLPDHAIADQELTEHSDERLWANALELVSGVDVLIHDAMFVESERAFAIAYGHSTVEAALALAERARVGRLILFHHAPDRTDKQLASMVASLSQDMCKRGSVTMEVGSESQVVDLPEPTDRAEGDVRNRRTLRP